MGKFQIYQDGRAAGANPISGSDFVTKDYLENHSGVELDPVYKADSSSLKASASLASASNTWITLNSGSLAISMSYDSDQKKIKLFSSGSTVVAEIDATDFIKDGMVNTITLDTSSLDLTITFNTDAGKEDIVVPMRNVFDLTMFYTKDETYNKEEIDTTVSTLVQNSQTGSWTSASNWLGTNSASLVASASLAKSAIQPAATSSWAAAATWITANSSSALAVSPASVTASINAAIGGITASHHTHSNKAVLDGITAAKTASWEASGTLAKNLTAISASLIASGTLAKNVTAITASLVASASVAKTASSSAAAISAKTGSYDALVGLPAVTAADNGKILMVVNGAWTLVSVITVYSGSAAPSNDMGNNGDIYLQS